MKRYNIKVNGNTYEVTVDSVDENGVAKVSVNGNDYKVEVSGDYAARQVARCGQQAAGNSSAASAVAGSAADVAPVAGGSSAGGNSAGVPAAAGAASASAGGCDVFAHLPGVIIGISVNVGDRVQEGQTVAVLEAMKMENSIEAECSGVIKAIHVQKGDSVLEGAKIVTIG